MSEIKVIMLGDIVGRVGREAVKKVLPELREKYQPDLIIANAENLSHGKGVSERTLTQMMEAGIDFFTSGNHIWNNKEVIGIFEAKNIPIVRPANYPAGVPGVGYRFVEVGTKKVLIVNLVGRVFFSENFECPFRTLERILEETKADKPDAVIVDFHAEATSEKKTLSNYFDGQVSLIAGTHTHIQTADEQVLPHGTGYITDLGMSGAKYSSLGIDFGNVIKAFLTQVPQNFEVAEAGACIVGGIFATISTDGSVTTKIERIAEEVDV